eukprot:gnl/Trimastix_PCT/2002.p1 GENE.gnl/Trimastix_PCT/2002~~gnl/Trimastix_PCT/2002.p1  ORF type:complete len:561 (-),score=95.78 gnl/Trimastix_PCT/2002:29-1711(-)
MDEELFSETEVTCVEFKRNQHIVLESTRDLMLAGHSFTIEAWVYIQQWSTAGQKDNTICGTKETQNQKSLHFTLRNKIPYFGFYYCDVHATQELPKDRWHHLAATYETEGGIQRLYVNAQKVAEKAGQAPLEGENVLLMGRWAGEANQRTLRGRLCQFRIWDHARNEADLAALMHRGAIGSEAGLVCCLDFADKRRTLDLVSGRTLGRERNGPHYERVTDLPLRIWPAFLRPSRNPSTTEVLFQNAGLAKALGSFQWLLTSQTWTDVDVVAQGEHVFPAHRAVLASRSPFFREELERLDQSSGRCTLHVAASARALQEVLQWIYSGRFGAPATLLGHPVGAHPSTLASAPPDTSSPFALLDVERLEEQLARRPSSPPASPLLAPTTPPRSRTPPPHSSRRDSHTTSTPPPPHTGRTLRPSRFAVAAGAGGDPLLGCGAHLPTPLLLEVLHAAAPLGLDASFYGGLSALLATRVTGNLALAVQTLHALTCVGGGGNGEEEFTQLRAVALHELCVHWPRLVRAIGPDGTWGHFGIPPDVEEFFFAQRQAECAETTMQGPRIE